jgi:hypothetical protein
MQIADGFTLTRNIALPSADSARELLMIIASLLAQPNSV